MGNRRQFLQTTAASAAGILTGTPLLAQSKSKKLAAAEPPFRISLAEWSLHRAIFAGKMTNLDFPVVARNEFDIDAVEYVSQLFKDKARDESYLGDLKQRCEGEGVRSLLIMVDGEGNLGDPDAAARSKAVENHRKWLEAAKFLGCHSIRVNASSRGSFEEQQKLAADGLARLGDVAAPLALNVLVENHGGLSSNGKWLVGVMKLAAKPNVGTLPDFGNFLIEGRGKPEAEQVWYDRYEGVKELMPFAKAVSAKSYAFDASGEAARTDFKRMMHIVHEAGYRGYVGVEWEGESPDEYEGIRLTKRLLERIQSEMS